MAAPGLQAKPSWLVLSPAGHQYAHRAQQLLGSGLSRCCTKCCKQRVMVHSPAITQDAHRPQLRTQLWQRQGLQAKQSPQSSKLQSSCSSSANNGCRQCKARGATVQKTVWPHTGRSACVPLRKKSHNSRSANSAAATLRRPFKKGAQISSAKDELSGCATSWLGLEPVSLQQDESCTAACLSQQPNGCTYPVQQQPNNSRI